MLTDKEFDEQVLSAIRASWPYGPAVSSAVRTLITEARAMREALTWKPIFGFPDEWVDGRPILMKSPSGDWMVTAKWTSDGWVYTDDDARLDLTDVLGFDPANLIMPEVGS